MDINDYKIKKSQWVMFIIISAGLLYLTGSWFMSLGIMILLILLDFALASWSARRRGMDDM